MAKINKIVPSGGISSFRQVAPSGGDGFRVLAEGLNAAYQQMEPAALQEMKRRGAEVGREEANAQFGDLQITPGTNGVISSQGGDASAATLDMIRQHEGFRESPYWDVNALRAGYGSDTVTLPDGSVQKVGKGTRVSREDAERDLLRRVNGEFIPAARRGVGADVFDGLNPAQKAALTSLTYNYGAGAWKDDLAGVASAARSGDAGAVGKAIAALGSHNGGVNQKRRAQEAQAFASGAISTQGSAPAASPQISIRTSEGKLESRMFSPLSGPILQAHNQAAGVAYQSSVIDKGARDIMDISQQFPLDPDGFKNAAQEYVDTLIGAAPEIFKGAIRDSLENEAFRRYAGVMDDQQRDIRARANNSSKALVERWSQDYEDALVSGNPDEIASARAQLDGVLQAREALPGVAWTTEQSANVLLDSERRAERSRQSIEKKRMDAAGDQLDLITKSAKEGRTVEDESVLSNPSVAAALPEKVREAKAFVAMRDNMPEFLEMTPTEMVAAVQRMREANVQEEWQLDIVDAAEKVAKANVKAWKDDPVKRAGEVLETPPPQISDLNPDEPDKTVEAFAARRDYVNKTIIGGGYSDTRAYLTVDEAEAFKAALGKGTPPELRAALAGAIVAGFGPDAVRVFDEIGGDKVTSYAGKMMAIGGSPALAAEIMRGQQVMDEGVVNYPSASSVRETFQTNFGTAFAGIPGGVQAQAEVMDAARAIYAARAVGVTLDEAGQDTLMAESINTALGGGMNKRGEATGGIQPVFGASTLLPIGMSGKEADQKVRMALGSMPHGSGFWGGMANLGAAMKDELPDGPNMDAWSAASAQGVPLLNGKAIPRNLLKDGHIRIVAAGQNNYRMEITVGASTFDASDENGDVFFFDLKKLMEAME